jgi:secreted trypsin-like serine protease
MNLTDFRRRALASAAASAVALTAAAAFATSPAQAADVPQDPDIDVVGGTAAPEGAYPWMVRLSMGCGGAMITDQVVLTAAHCVDGTGNDASITASYGSVDLQSPDIVDYQSQYVHQSDTYSGQGRGDWALIKLSQPVADVSTLPIADNTDHDSGEFIVMGWGAASEGGGQQRYLLHATVPFVDDATCANAYSDLDAAGEICAGLMDTGGVDTCQGDSGGPMVSEVAPGQYVEVGIVSWGEGCARPGKPGVYTQASTWHSDIQAALANLP